MPKKVDALVFAPHPDDGEIFCGGTIAGLVSKKYRVGLIDMTRGELGSQGNVAKRKKESEQADKILKISFRKNLGLKDGSLSDPTQKKSLNAVVKVIREYKPSIVLAPYWEDRHPDHVGAGQLVSKAVFYAALRKFLVSGTAPHSVNQALFYPTRVNIPPSILVDITASFKTKLAAINCYGSQVTRDPKLAGSGIKTLVSSPLAISSITDRDGFFGSMIGVRYAEPFIIRNAIRVDDPVKFFNERPLGEALFLNR
jgi:bacillithiol biosynthesis deacetylase BshB1